MTQKSFNFARKFNLPFYFVSAADGTNVVKVKLLCDRRPQGQYVVWGGGGWHRADVGKKEHFSGKLLQASACGWGLIHGRAPQGPGVVMCLAPQGWGSTEAPAVP